jgi:sugar lactone lactonase YvrE
MHARQVLRVTPDGTATAIVEVPGQPSGLGWLPAVHGGDLLVVSMTDRRLLRWNGTTLSEHANLAGLASFHCNDMVVDRHGRAYVGNFGFDLHGQAAPRPAELICVDPDGRARVAADQLMFPNGTVITPDGRTLIVAESWGARLTAFDLHGDGELTNRRIWAPLPDSAVPDGICLDEAGGIWSASPSTNECIRQVEGGEVTHRVTLDQGAFACMLGGNDGRTLYILTAADSDPDACREKRSGRIEICTAPYAHAGLP